MHLPTVNQNLDKMEHVLNNSDDQNHKALIVAAFGQRAYDNHREAIKANVAAIKAADIPTRLSPGTNDVFREKPPAHGNTKWIEGLPNQWHSDSIQFGRKFFGEDFFGFVDQQT